MTEEYAGLFLVVVVVVVVGRIGNKWGSGEEKNDPIVAVNNCRATTVLYLPKRARFVFVSPNDGNPQLIMARLAISTHSKS